MVRAYRGRKSVLGFTLAELLIALLILGEIATFTIPKIITAQANGRYNAVAKETISMVAAAYQQYSYTNGISGSVGIAALTQYMNYVKVDTTTVINSTSSTYNCGGGGSNRCLALHNGAYLYYDPITNFSGTNTTNGVWFGIDPSGVNDTVYSAGFALTYTGRVMSYGDVDTTYTYNTGTIGPGATNPSWFSW